MNANIGAARNCNELTFRQWLDQADAYVRATAGITLDDLPDASTWDAWNAGEEPDEFAAEHMAECGYTAD